MRQITMCFCSVLFGMTCYVLVPTSILLWLSAGNTVFNPHPGEWWAVNIPLAAELQLCDRFWIYSISMAVAVAVFLLRRRRVLTCAPIAMTVASIFLQLMQCWITLSFLWASVALGVLGTVVIQLLSLRRATHGFEVITTASTALPAPSWPKERPAYSDRPR
jgi:hypothetical protein